MATIDLVEWLKNDRKFFMNIARDFRPEQGDFRPAPEMLTVAQQIRHVALTVDWFREGGFGKGFDLNFEEGMREMFKPCTLAEALEALGGAFDAFIETVRVASAEKLAEAMAPNPILGELPRTAAVYACGDHTAHHRGSLAVYLRLLGTTPKMIYMD